MQEEVFNKFWQRTCWVTVI